MKNNCDMARDLIPLTIDGVASEASRRYVEEHLEECAECRAYLAGMKATLADGAQRVAKERASFDRTAARMRRRRALRRFGVLALSVPLILALIIGGWNFCQYYMAELSSRDYTVTLSQLRSGVVVVSARTFRVEALSSLDRHETMDKSGGRVLALALRGYPLRRANTPRTIVTQLPSLDGYSAAVYGTDGRSLWDGGDVAPASEQMEAYYAARDALYEYVEELERRYDTYWRALYDETLPGEEKERWRALRSDALNAMRRVPEWYGADIENLPQIQYMLG